MRHQHAGGAVIKRGKQSGRRRFGHPDDAGGTGSTRAEQGGVDRDPVEGRMFLVDHDKIKSNAPKEFGRMARRRLDKRPDERVAAHEALTKRNEGCACRHVR